MAGSLPDGTAERDLQRPKRGLDDLRAGNAGADAGPLPARIRVVPTGAHRCLGPAKLARPFGVKHVVHAGRGYSFTVTGDQVPDGPVYFPQQRVACTPLHEPVCSSGDLADHEESSDLLRIAGMMEFRRPTSRWTSDGLPLVGATTSPRVFVAGGHGMWGVALGPATGKLLAEQIAQGSVPEALVPFDPLR